MAAGSGLTSSGLTGFAVPNSQLSATVAANALTISILTSDGNTPSPTEPLNFAIRDPATGAMNAYIIAAALSLVVSSGSTLDVASGGVPFRLWVVLFDDAGTLRLGVTKCTDVNRYAIYPLNDSHTLSATAEGGAGGADSSGVVYAAQAVTSKAFRIVGSLDWTSGLTTAGTWDTAPDITRSFREGMKRPGDVVQDIPVKNGNTVLSDTTTIPLDNTIPQSSEGSAIAFWDVAIAATSVINFIDYRAEISVSNHTGSLHMIGALFKDSDAGAVRSDACKINAADDIARLSIDHRIHPADTNSHTYKLRVGGSSAGTWTVNGVNNAGILGGVLATWSSAKELTV